MYASVPSQQAPQRDSRGPRCALYALQPTNYQLGVPMNISLSIGPVVSLIAGILILIAPRLLNYIVAIYLILIGLIGLFGMGSMHLR
jgi:hypothetical protein